MKYNNSTINKNISLQEFLTYYPANIAMKYFSNPKKEKENKNSLWKKNIETCYH